MMRSNMRRRLYAAALAMIFTASGLPVAAFAGGGLDADAWYYPGMRFCVDRGYLDEGLAPNEPLTRGELARMMHAFDDFPTFDFDDPDMDPEYVFSDLERGDEYTGAADWCGRKGIFAGYGDGAFNADAVVTRQQLAVVLRAFAAFKGYAVDAGADLSSYPDCGDVAAWARGSLEWCVARGLIAGSMENGVVKLLPRAVATRAQIATILKAFRAKVIDRETAETALGGTYFLDGGGGEGFHDPYILYEEMLALALERTAEPGFLYVGLAGTGEHGDTQLSDYFGGEGCTCDVLYMRDLDDPAVVRAKIAAADIVYVGGGSTVQLVGLLKEHGIDALLREAAKRGVIMAGTSAGAICFCSTGESWVDIGHMRVDGIGCVDVLYCPHALDGARYSDSMNELKNTPYTRCVAFDGAALEIHDGKFRAIRTCRGDHVADLCEYRDGEIKVTPLTEEWRPIEELFGRDVRRALD